MNECSFCCHSFSNSHHQEDVVQRENGTHCDEFTVTCCIFTFRPDTFDFSKQPLSYTLLSGTVHKLQMIIFFSNLPSLKTKCWTVATSRDPGSFRHFALTDDATHK